MQAEACSNRKAHMPQPTAMPQPNMAPVDPDVTPSHMPTPTPTSCSAVQPRPGRERNVGELGAQLGGGGRRQRGGDHDKAGGGRCGGTQWCDLRAERAGLACKQGPEGQGRVRAGRM